jgi:hypothetical protein
MQNIQSKIPILCQSDKKLKKVRQNPPKEPDQPKKKKVPAIFLPIKK